MTSNLGLVLVFSLIGGVVSLAGGLLLVANKKRAKGLARYATPFAAGALLSAAFIDLLADAVHEGEAERALTAALLGIIVFFLLERFLRWFHHHHVHSLKGTDPTTSLVVVGDTLHNFIDGIAIAAGFLVDVSTGIIVTLAVAAHEIPQEIGDFGLLLHKGLKSKSVIVVNVISAAATTVAAMIFYLLGQEVSVPLDIVLGLVAGFFIYIAVSDIIPSIHAAEEKILAGVQTVMLIAGVITVATATNLAHQYIEVEAEHEARSTNSSYIS